jgi:hypothetical protein
VTLTVLFHEGGCAMNRLLEKVHQLGWCTNKYLQTAKNNLANSKINTSDS